MWWGDIRRWLGRELKLHYQGQRCKYIQWSDCDSEAGPRWKCSFRMFETLTRRVLSQNRNQDLSWSNSLTLCRTGFGHLLMALAFGHLSNLLGTGETLQTNYAQHLECIKMCISIVLFIRMQMHAHECAYPHREYAPILVGVVTVCTVQVAVCGPV